MRPVSMVILAVAATLLGSCTVEVVDGPPPGPPPGRPQFCTQEHAPVCGVRGDRRSTFPNACMADRAGYRILHRGECPAGRPPDRRPQAWSHVYSPCLALCGHAPP